MNIYQKKKEEKIARNLSPIHRDNSNEGNNIEDELNKAMIDSDE